MSVQGHQRAASLVVSCIYAILWTINIDTLRRDQRSKLDISGWYSSLPPRLGLWSATNWWAGYKRSWCWRCLRMWKEGSHLMVECSTEAVPQFFYLTIFTVASVLLPRTSGLVLVKEESFKKWTFVTVFLLLTYYSIISAIQLEGHPGTLLQLLAHLVTIGLQAPSFCRRK